MINSIDFYNSISGVLGDKSSLEIDWRNAISRAYYSAYHECKAHVNITKYPETGVHGNLIKSMADSGDKDLMALALQLDKCRKKRVKADYHLEKNLLPSEVQQVLIESKKIYDKMAEKFTAQQPQQTSNPAP